MNILLYEGINTCVHIRIDTKIKYIYILLMSLTVRYSMCHLRLAWFKFDLDQR